jgi:hypothetical protein
MTNIDKHNIAEACPTTQHVQKAQQFDLIEAVAVIEATAFSVISASRGSMRHRKHLVTGLMLSTKLEKV